MIREFPIGLGLQLDEALKDKEDAKSNKTKTAKSIIREFICNLKRFAWRLEEFGPPRASFTEEDERNFVYQIARCATAELQLNSHNLNHIKKIESRIDACNDLCEAWEEIIRLRLTRVS